jgi:hypothetical protein
VYENGGIAIDAEWSGGVLRRQPDDGTPRQLR